MTESKEAERQAPKMSNPIQNIGMTILSLIFLLFTFLVFDTAKAKARSFTYFR